MRTHMNARAAVNAKAMAKSLRDSLAARDVLLSHSACLEIVAKQFGCADWNTLSAKLQQLSCSFCGKTQHEVRSLCEGGCNAPGTSCVFICDDCVALCAQVNDDLIGSAAPGSS